MDLRNSAGVVAPMHWISPRRERRLEDVGRVQRALGRARADQGVQLVDEDDGVLVFHQLFHDGLEALLELAAVLGAGHDEREIQAEDALLGEEAGHFAVGDALGEALDDGRLAHAGLADEDGIVLGAAAENLDHALQFAVAAHERIELAVHGRLGQVAAELGQQAGLALALLRRGFFLRDAAQLFANLRQLQAALLQDLRGEALFLAQQAQQQVFGADVLVAQPFGLFRRIGQHALALVRERQVHAGRDLFADGGVRLNLLANRLHRGVRAQEAVGQRLVLAQQAQQQVLGLDIGRAELAGLIPREEDHAPRLLRIAFEHRGLPCSNLFKLTPTCSNVLLSELDSVAARNGAFFAQILPARASV